MADHHNLLEKIKVHINGFFAGHDTETFVYHNIKHTQYVVDAAMRIANHYQLNDDDFFVVIAAAWFHDIGYLIDRSQHEEKSAGGAREFLAAEGVEPGIIQQVTDCILATRMPQKPMGLLQDIICDADLFHLGTGDFAKKNKLMRQEYDLLHGGEISKAEWRDKTVSFFQDFEYHTDYCRLLLTDKKNRNLEALKNKVYKEDDTDEAEEEVIHEIAGETIVVKEPKPDKPDKKKAKRPDKGIETMFRISSNNHSRLSDMADNKAHILITVNSILLSAVISLVLRRLDTSSFLTLPSFIQLAVSLVTIIFAILATRPTIPHGTFTPQDIDKKQVNLLFFGNFYRMNLEDYRGAMTKVMDDSEFLYDNLIRDVYSQGIVLGKKYRLLRIAYNIFMIGLSISVIAFIISTAYSGTTPAAPAK